MDKLQLMVDCLLSSMLVLAEELFALRFASRDPEVQALGLEVKRRTRLTAKEREEPRSAEPSEFDVLATAND